MKLEQFLELDEDPDVDSKLAAKAIELGAARQAEQIKSRAALTQTVALSINADGRGT